MKLRAVSLFAAASLLASSAFAQLTQTGSDVMIGGFVVQGTAPKSVIVRAIGPELTPFGIPDALADPTLELHDGTGALIASNDNWQTTVIGGIITSNQVSAIQNSGRAPTQPSESAIIATLQPGNYTAIVRGRNNTTGVALVEVYDLNPNTTSVLGNISTRAFVASDVQTTPFAQLTASDVQTIINHAVTRAVTVSPNSVIAVTDREGDVLGVWVMRGGSAMGAMAGVGLGNVSVLVLIWTAGGDATVMDKRLSMGGLFGKENRGVAVWV